MHNKNTQNFCAFQEAPSSNPTGNPQEHEKHKLIKSQLQQRKAMVQEDPFTKDS